MSKALPLLLSLLLFGAVSHMAAQTVVCTNNVDQYGNVCTKVATAPTLSVNLFYIDSEDGKPEPADFTGVVDVSGCPYSHVDIPFDPLILDGKVPGYGGTASDLVGFPCQAAVIAHGGLNATTWFTEQWTLTGLTNPYNNDYPYTWSGTFTVTFTCQHVGRYGRGCGYYKAGEGSGEFSAVHD